MRRMTWAMSCLILGNGLMPALAQPAEAAAGPGCIIAMPPDHSGR